MMPTAASGGGSGSVLCTTRLTARPTCRWSMVSSAGQNSPHGDDSLTHRRIAELISNGPPTIPEEVSYAEKALGHPERVRYFTEQLAGPTGLVVAAHRPEFNRLFDPVTLSDEDRTVAQALTAWVLDQYVMDDKESLSLFASFAAVRSPGTWETLAHRLFAQEQRVPDWQVPWLGTLFCIALQPTTAICSTCSCARSHGRTPDLGFYAASSTARGLCPGPAWTSASSSDAPRFEVAFAGDDHWLDEAWKKVFVPLLPQHAPELQDLAVRQLRDANRLAGALQPGFDALSFGRSAIERHPQDEFRDVADVLIDAARDSLEHLLHGFAPDEAAAMVERLAQRRAEPILRRLAVHAWRIRQDRTPDEKLRWILDEDLLYDLDLQHEVYVLLGDTVALASDDAVGAVLDRAKDGPQDGAEHSPGRPSTLLAWPQMAAPENVIIAEEFTRLQEQHPEFALREHPDLNMTMSSGFVEYAEPFTRDELHGLIEVEPGRGVRRHPGHMHRRRVPARRARPGPER